MKKVLFATTALVAFAGAASADITVSGTAEMGIAGGSGTTPTTFFQSFDVRFTGSGETDNGLSFGATLDLEDVIDSARTNAIFGSPFGSDVVDDAGSFADYTVFISGAFGRLTLGDTDGAFDWAMDDVNTARNAGSIGDNETGHGGYNGNGLFDSIYNGQILTYTYSVGGFGAAISAEVDGTAARDGDPVLQLGLTYDLDFAGGDVQFGLGYVTVGDANRTSARANSVATAGATFNLPVGAAVVAPIAGNQGFDAVGVSALVNLEAGFSAAINYTEINDSGFFGGDGEHMGIGVGYNFDAITVSANYGEYDWAPGASLVDAEGYGLAASYNLGGGVTAHLGYGRTRTTALNNSAAVLPAPTTAPAIGTTSTWSFGLRMAF